MQLVMLGLGRMGAGIVRRLRQHEVDVIGFDVNADVNAAIAAEGIPTLADLRALPAPRAVWVMVPSHVTSATIQNVAQYLEPGDVIIDGGNSFYRDDIANAAWLAERGIAFVDVGTSGGVYGLERGFSLMIGGETQVVEQLTSVFAALAPGVDAAVRTPGRAGEITTAEQGFLHCGPVGAGHFVKMVHNGIEYGAMAAYAEGLNLLDAARHGITHPIAVGGSSESKYDLDLAAVTEVWRRGSVVAAWLLDLTAEAFVEDGQLAGYTGAVADSGEGRWTVSTAVDAGVPANVLSAALMGRFASRGNDLFANKVLSAMRRKFGGHAEATKKTGE
jgi:6-phosphogluconate dehydrogenase